MQVKYFVMSFYFVGWMHSTYYDTFLYENTYYIIEFRNIEGSIYLKYCEAQ